MKSQRTWIVVADGGRAGIYENHGINDSIHPLESERVNPEVSGPAEDPTEFARRLGARLRDAAVRKRFDRLVLVAPPRFMGMINSELEMHARDRIIARLEKDLTHLPLPELARHLTKVMNLDPDASRGMLPDRQAAGSERAVSNG